jgi:hypothetical protein
MPRKPACRNSSQKATASFAPAIQENQLAAPARALSCNGACKTSSAPNTEPPGFTIRASSLKISSRNGFRLKIPFTANQVELPAIDKVEILSLISGGAKQAVG